ncbi:MAG: methyltransferase [Bacillota bacterium]
MAFEQKNLFPPMELLLVGAAVKVGLFDALKDGPLPEDVLAAGIQSDARSLWVVIQALVDAGYLQREGGAVNLTPGARDMFYNPQSDGYTGFSFMHGYELCRSWLSLPEVIRSGRPVKRERTKDSMKSFIMSMALHARKVAPVFARDCLEGLPGGAAVLDIGGGPLTYAREFALLGAKVTVLDLPEVVEMMKPALEGSAGIEMVPGDMTVGLPRGPFDLAYLGNVCHIFNEGENRRIFARAHAVLKDGGRIAVQDFVRGISPRAAMFGVNMLVNTPGGGTWTLEQYREWLSGAGFSGVELKDYGERQLITANKNQ